MAIKQIPAGRNRGRYRIDWRDEYGVRHYEIQGYNRRQAESILAAKITNRAEKRTLDVKGASGITFFKLCDRYMDDYAKQYKTSWKTDASKIRKFKAYFNNRRIESIKRDDIRDYAIARRRQVQGGTVNKEVAILKKIFWFAVDSAWIEANPAARWQEYPENPAIDRYLEWGQYLSHLSAIGSIKAGWRGRLHLDQFRYIIPLAYEAGGRRGEIVGMKADDLDFERRNVRFWYRKGKNRELKSRWVPMTESLYDLLQMLPVRQDTPYLFPDERGGLWRSKIAFYRNWSRIAVAAGLGGEGFHRLRHSYCSQMANKGTDESTRMRLMGHTSPITQQRYTHISEDRKRQAVQVFENLRKDGTGYGMDTPAVAETIREFKDIES